MTLGSPTLVLVVKYSHSLCSAAFWKYAVKGLLVNGSQETGSKERHGAEELQLLDALGRNLHGDLPSHWEVREKNKMRNKFFIRGN